MNLEYGNGVLSIHFQTAWSPPVPWLDCLLEKIDNDISFYYIEEGEDFAGRVERKNGIFKNESWSPFERKIKNNIPTTLQKIMKDKINLSVEIEKENLITWILDTHNNLYEYDAELILEECEILTIKIQSQIKIWQKKNKLYKMAKFFKVSKINNEIINVALLPPDTSEISIFKKGGALFREKMKKYT